MAVRPSYHRGRLRSCPARSRVDSALEPRTMPQGLPVMRNGYITAHFGGNGHVRAGLSRRTVLSIASDDISHHVAHRSFHSGRSVGKVGDGSSIGNCSSRTRRCQLVSVKPEAVCLSEERSQLMLYHHEPPYYCTSPRLGCSTRAPTPLTDPPVPTPVHVLALQL